MHELGAQYMSWGPVQAVEGGAMAPQAPPQIRPWGRETATTDADDDNGPAANRITHSD